MLSLDLGNGAVLRALEPWNAREFFDHIDSIRDHLNPWIGLAAACSDLEKARRVLQSYADKQAQDAGRIYGIWVDGKLSGGTLFRVFSAEAGNCEVGIWLAPQAQGRGLITTAVRHMIDWAFQVREMSRVEWLTLPTNERSIAIAKRLGMTCEGTRRSDYIINGKRTDSQIWSVLADEWDPALSAKR